MYTFLLLTLTTKAEMPPHSQQLDVYMLYSLHKKIFPFLLFLDSVRNEIIKLSLFMEVGALIMTSGKVLQ